MFSTPNDVIAHGKVQKCKNLIHGSQVPCDAEALMHRAPVESGRSTLEGDVVRILRRTTQGTTSISITLAFLKITRKWEAV